MASKRMCFVVFVLAAFLVLTPGKMFAQMAGTGSMLGQFIDPSGAAGAGQTATLTDISTSSVRTSVSNEAGRYFFANVLPGTYDITITKTGFRQAKLSKQAVNVGSEMTLNV